CYLIVQCLFSVTLKKSKRETTKRCTFTYKTRPSAEFGLPSLFKISSWPGEGWRTDLWVKGLHICVTNTNQRQNTLYCSALYCSVLRKVCGSRHSYGVCLCAHLQFGVATSYRC